MAVPGRPLPSKLYRAVWRWHFYAGLFCVPWLLVLSITGGLYAFRSEIERGLYGRLTRVPAQRSLRLTGTQAVELALADYPGSRVISYTPPFELADTAHVMVAPPGQKPREVFIDPYRGRVLGSLDPDERVMSRVRRLHGTLLAGPLGRIVVEIAAGWTFVLIVTGFFLWVPRQDFMIAGTLLPRLTQGAPTLLRDLHVVPGAWVGLALCGFIATGMPYSILSGNLMMLVAGTSRVGPGWAQADRFESQLPSAAGERTPMTWDQVIGFAESREITPPYEIIAPVGERGVFSVRSLSPDPRDVVYLHLDQYTGEVLASYPFADQGLFARMIAIGFAVHEGRMLGIPNQIFAVAVAAGTFLMTVGGVVLWWMRRPAGRLGAPRWPPKFQLPEWVPVVAIILCFLFPMAALSFAALFAFERYGLPKLPRLRWLFE